MFGEAKGVLTPRPPLLRRRRLGEGEHGDGDGRDGPAGRLYVPDATASLDDDGWADGVVGPAKAERRCDSADWKGQNGDDDGSRGWKAAPTDGYGKGYGYGDRSGDLSYHGGAERGG